MITINSTVTVCLSAWPSVHPSVYLALHIYRFVYLLTHLFAHQPSIFMREVKYLLKLKSVHYTIQKEEGKKCTSETNHHQTSSRLLTTVYLTPNVYVC